MRSELTYFLDFSDFYGSNSTSMFLMNEKHDGLDHEKFQMKERIRGSSTMRKISTKFRNSEKSNEKLPK